MSNLQFTPNRHRQPKDVLAHIERRKNNVKTVNRELVKINDGGRAEAGFDNVRASDCVTRAIAIATGKSYMEVYSHMASKNRELGRNNNADSGVSKDVYGPYLESLGLVKIDKRAFGENVSVEEFCTREGLDWATMSKANKRKYDNKCYYETSGYLNGGMLKRFPNAIYLLSKHMVAAVDGVINDTYDSIKGGKRSVYEIWVKP